MESRHHKTSQRRKRRCLNLFGIILLIFSLCRGATVSEAKISKYDPLVKKHARRYGFDWRLISAQIYAESSFRSDVVSYAGAVGLMQIMPSTAKWLGVDPKLLTKPEVSISLGCYYDWRLYSALKDTDTERNRLAITLASYNCGPGRMRRARRKSSNGSWAQVKPYLPKETQHYVPKIFSKYAEYKKITLRSERMEASEWRRSEAKPRAADDAPPRGRKGWSGRITPVSIPRARKSVSTSALGHTSQDKEFRASA